MKKILFILIIFLSLITCGKKNDPEYKAINTSESQKILI